ncbi:MAG: N-acetylneuraminate synthase [Syntrophomonadaceae bacterium]|nr:N-acetylneuraminate synthase [Syntrophomonadaceae bacterium]
MAGVYIIAEAGINHNGSVEMACQLIDRAAEAGADAVKFQTFKAESLVCRSAPEVICRINGSHFKETQFDMLKKLEIDENQYKMLLKHCKTRNLEFISSPFDEESMELLAYTLNIPRLKIASGEINNLPLLLKAAYTGKKIILSTGMCSLGEVETALAVIAFGCTENDKKPSMENFMKSYSSSQGQAALKERVTLLHCTSEYPAPYKAINLRAMDTLKQAFDLDVGLSDHSHGIAIAIAAAARGAVLIEKHFTLDKKLPGPDHKISLEPDELLALVKSIRQVEMALGSPTKTVSVSEFENRCLVRKSLVAVKPIAKGQKFTEENITAKRPGTGLAPSYYWSMLGQTAQKDYQPDDLVEI